MILFLFGAISYSLLEIIWRGFTHWSMFVLGGLCFLLVSQVAVSCCGRLPLWFCCVVNTLLITGLEFVTGCVVNLGFGWNVWNYTNQPLNLMGQVCIGFTALWFLLSVPVTELAFQVRRRLQGKRRPNRRLAIGRSAGRSRSGGRGPRWGGGRKSPHTAPWPAGRRESL